MVGLGPSSEENGEGGLYLRGRGGGDMCKYKRGRSGEMYIFGEEGGEDDASKRLWK